MKARSENGALTHQEVQELLGSYVSQTLPEEQAAPLRAHLAGCDDCRGDLALERCLRTVPPPEPAGLDPERAFARLAARLPPQPKPPPSLTQRWRSWFNGGAGWMPYALAGQTALMVLLGIGVKVGTLPVIALGVGIGIDYALYVMSIMLAQLRRGATLAGAYHKALLFTGKVVMLTAVTLAVGVATWTFSPIKFQADMGILLAFMFFWNMMGALVLLPALACFLLPPGQYVERQVSD